MIEHGDRSKASNSVVCQSVSLRLLLIRIGCFFFSARWISLNGIVRHTVALNEMTWIDAQVEVIYKNSGMGMWFMDGMLTHECCI